MVHAHSRESIKDAVNAGCKQIEHGVFVDDDALKLMAARACTSTRNIGVVLPELSAQQGDSSSASATTTRKASPTWRKVWR